MAEAYGIGTGTFSGILKRHNASRKIGLTPDEIEDVAERYEAGQSLAQIAEAFAVVANTIRAALLAHGITLRSTSA